MSIANTVVAFNKANVEATQDIVCAYKPNFAFYIAHGDEGVAALNRTIVDIHIIAPDVPVILDCKDGDIGNTNAGYVKMAFDYCQADAITVSPYLGGEALQPFLDCKDKGIFVLCRTSNPGAGEFQDLRISTGPVMVDNDPPYRPLYQIVAQNVAANWNKNGNCALVVGATYPDELRQVRELVGDMPILIPAVGAQGGDVEKAVKAGKNSQGQGMIFNSSRGIIFASNGPDFAEAARRETLKLHTLINQYR
ncbi:orotidine 5'-phosphate decarboxylase [Candidatus Kaiserbacteria bacterium GWA2_50_9]|uniref:Orotidine-5'-phosphate decarboxylase n=1 Tax=Candidatus Kaiserbacteria bacterium GWA2_50_9 TaxID=1798474 RepID=A0A1F6BVN7_9BACT|nr:MAG: orotidine 5'-phosphate decarboxylase [Candidatus Kaiserbacteria bacterium GWA2_50_9]